MKNILVVGSLNMDMVITVDRVPKLGETLSGDEGMVKHQSARKTHVVDTTAAGDSFIGGMCVAMCEVKSFADAIEFATRVSSMVVSKKGTGPSIPYREEVDLLK